MYHDLEQVVPPGKAVPVRETFAKVLAEDRHDRPEAYEFRMRQMFRGIEIPGKSAVDVGSGRGLTSLWMALQGARRVVSMEPEMDGSRSGAVQVQRERIERLGLEQVEIATTAFQDYQPGELFDIVVSNASINHLEESEHHALRDRKTFDTFVEIAAQMKQWLRPGGAAAITDASRYGLFSLARSFGVPKQLCYYSKTINYKIHQNAGTWRKIFREAGFQEIEIEYPFPYGLRHLGPVVNNPAASFCLQGSFMLRAWT